MAHTRLFLSLLGILWCGFAAAASNAAAQIDGQTQLRAPKRAAAEKQAAEKRGALAGGSETPLNAALFGGAPFPASAAAEKQGAFSYLPEGGFIRISFARAESGNRNNAAGALYGIAELDLKPGRKTYWRNPGSSGLAPQIELDGGARAEILFPPPQLLREGEEWNYGYKNHVILPFRITLPANAGEGAAAALYTGSLFLGICDKTCMPQKLAFRLNTAALKADKKQSALLRQALAALPKAADKNFGLISVKPAATGKTPALELRLAAPAAAAGAQLYLDGGDDLQLGAAELQNRKTACPPPAAKAKRKRSKDKARLKTCPLIFLYRAPLLFGEAKKGAVIRYTAIVGKSAVSGAAELE